MELLGMWQGFYYIIIPLLCAGTLFLWLFWPSFNGALAGADSQYRAIINTYYSMTGSVIASFIFSISLNGKRKLDMVR